MNQKQHSNGRRQMAPDGISEAICERPDREGERLLSVWVPESLHYEIKLLCLERRITIKTFVVNAILDKFNSRS